MGGSPPAFSSVSRFPNLSWSKETIYLPYFISTKRNTNKFCPLFANMKVTKVVLGSQLLLAACVFASPIALEQNALEARNGMLMF